MAEPERHIEVPIDSLSEDALRGLVEEFVSRDGTDYGEVEASFESKVRDVWAQLETGQVFVAFDPETESVTLVPRERDPVG